MAGVYFKPIVFKGDLIPLAEIDAAVDRAGEKIAKGALKDFEGTVRTWRKPPKFFIRRYRPGSYYVGTNNRIYKYVNDGTDAHLIVAKNAPFLMFKVPFSPKSKPGSLSSRKGRVGKNWRRKRQVMHPGTEARRFDLAIRDKRQPMYEREIAREMKKLVKAQNRK